MFASEDTDLASFAFSCCCMWTNNYLEFYSIENKQSTSSKLSIIICFMSFLNVCGDTDLS